VFKLLYDLDLDLIGFNYQLERSIPITTSYWKPIFVRFCKKNNYIIILFPDCQKKIMNEFSVNVEVLEKKREGSNTSIKTVITDYVINFLTNDFILNDEIKWNIIMIYKKEMEDPFFSSAHNGCVINICGIEKSDVEFVTSIIQPDLKKFIFNVYEADIQRLL
jgi:hypothetical protein